MTEDAMLRDILLDAAADEFAAELNDTTSIDASPRLRRQMTAMLSDPQGWVKRKRRPVWKRIAHAVAVIVLTFALSLGALMAVSPSVRAAVLHWIETWYGEYMRYDFTEVRSDDPNAPLPRYEITAFPEGFTQFANEDEFLGLYGVAYDQTETGRLFSFVYFRMEYGKSLLKDYDTGDTVLDVTVQGMPGRIILSASDEPDGSITWTDEKQNLMFSISGPFTKDELLRLAESVKLAEKQLNLPWYGVTDFPNGLEGEIDGQYTLLREKEIMYDVRDPNDESRRDMLRFFFARHSDTRILTADNLSDDYLPEDVTVNGCPGWFYADSTGWADDTVLIWSDEDAGMWFSLDGVFTKEELLRMAESVKMVDAAH